jgi:hypothetical protein
LRPDDPAIFGQGRHWKRVKGHFPSLITIVTPHDVKVVTRPAVLGEVDLFANPHSASKSPYHVEIWNAALEHFPDGIPPGYSDARLKRVLEPKLKTKEGMVLPGGGVGVSPKTYGRALEKYPPKP